MSRPTRNKPFLLSVKLSSSFVDQPAPDQRRSGSVPGLRRGSVGQVTEETGTKCIRCHAGSHHRRTRLAAATQPETPYAHHVTQSAAERYLRLGLQLGRHVEGIVDAYYGPPELAAAVDAEPPVEPRTLVAAAEALLDELEDGWLRDQVVGAAHLRRRAGGRVRLVRGRGGGVLRRAADLHRRSGLHGRARAARGVAPRQRPAGRAPPALAGLDPRAHRAGRAARWRRSSRSRERGRAAWSSCPRAKESRWRPCATSPGWRSAPTSATCVAESPSTSTSRCRPSSCSSSRSTRRIPDTTRSAAARITCSCAAEGCSRRRWCSCPRRSLSSRRGSPGSRRTCCSRATAGRRSRRSCTTPASSSISLMLSPSSGPPSRAGGLRSTRR